MQLNWGRPWPSELWHRDCLEKGHYSRRMATYCGHSNAPVEYALKEERRTYLYFHKIQYFRLFYMSLPIRALLLSYTVCHTAIMLALHHPLRWKQACFQHNGWCSTNRTAVWHTVYDNSCRQSEHLVNQNWNLKQIALLSPKGRFILCVCQQLA